MDSTAQHSPRISEWRVALASEQADETSTLSVDARLVGLQVALLIEGKGWLALTSDVAQAVAASCEVTPQEVALLVEENVQAGWMRRSGPALTLSIP